METGREGERKIRRGETVAGRGKETRGEEKDREERKELTRVALRGNPSSLSATPVKGRRRKSIGRVDCWDKRRNTYRKTTVPNLNTIGRVLERLLIDIAILLRGPCLSQETG